MIVRPMRIEDRRFIVPTWVRSFAEFAPWGPAATLAHHWRVVDHILDAPETTVMVLASDASARTPLHAWAAAAGSTLHYAYVPPELRGHDFACRAITAALGSYPKRIEVSHPWPKVRGQQHRRFRWQPYALLSLQQRIAA